MRLQETCCSSQVLKLCKSVQETNEEVLFIKAQQKPRQKLYLSRFNVEARQKLYLSRITKLGKHAHGYAHFAEFGGPMNNAMGPKKIAKSN